jgi:hypothetical protein
MKNLEPIDTGTKEPHFYWGRWESSSLFSAPLVAPYAGSRQWGPLNVLIAFDQRNLVQTWKVVKDRDLLKQLDQFDTSVAPLNLSSPSRLSVKLPYWEQDQTVSRVDLVGGGLRICSVAWLQDSSQQPERHGAYLGGAAQHRSLRPSSAASARSFALVGEASLHQAYC